MQRTFLDGLVKLDGKEWSVGEPPSERQRKTNVEREEYIKRRDEARRQMWAQRRAPAPPIPIPAKPVVDRPVGVPGDSALGVLPEIVAFMVAALALFVWLRWPN